MQASIQIVDQVPGGPRQPAMALPWAEARITARELIRRRVFEQVSRFASGDRAPPAMSPDAAADDGVALPLRRPKPLDWTEQCRLAIEAFEQQRLIVLADRRQVASLDEDIVVTPGMEVVFLKLVPLVGG